MVGDSPTDDPVPDGPTITIDAASSADRWRYTCPNGHRDWDRTNQHVWCRSCRRQIDQGATIDGPEHWHVVDQRTDEAIHWERVDLVEPAATPGRGRP